MVYLTCAQRGRSFSLYTAAALIPVWSLRSLAQNGRQQALEGLPHSPSAAYATVLLLSCTLSLPPCPSLPIRAAYASAEEEEHYPP
jgi:hypothetical protein